MKKQLSTPVLVFLGILSTFSYQSCYRDDFVYTNEERLYIIAVYDKNVDAVQYMSKDTLFNVPPYGTLNIDEIREDFEYARDSLRLDSLVGELDRQTRKIIGWQDANGDDENYREADDGSRWTWSNQVEFLDEI